MIISRHERLISLGHTGRVNKMAWNNRDRARFPLIRWIDVPHCAVVLSTGSEGRTHIRCGSVGCCNGLRELRTCLEFKIAGATVMHTAWIRGIGRHRPGRIRPSRSRNVAHKLIAGLTVKLSDDANWDSWLVPHLELARCHLSSIARLTFRNTTLASDRSRLVRSTFVRNFVRFALLHCESPSYWPSLVPSHRYIGASWLLSPC
jgi:hypothetical protein